MEIKTVEEINNQIAFQRRQLRQAKNNLNKAKALNDPRMRIGYYIEDVNCILATIGTLYWILGLDGDGESNSNFNHTCNKNSNGD